MATEGSAGSRSRLDLVLAVVVAFLVIVLVVLLVSEDRNASPATASGSEGVVLAARDGTAAVLSVDYRHLQAGQRAAAHWITGTFARQYARNAAAGAAAARRRHAVAVPIVREVAIVTTAARRATVLVAADLVRRNSSTRKAPATAACPHQGATCVQLRLRLQLVRRGAGWRIATVTGVS